MMKPPPRSELSSSAPARAGARVCWPTAGAFASATMASTSVSLRRTRAPGDRRDRRRCAHAASSSRGWPIALYRLRVGRVRAHIDALLPGALEGIAHAQAHAANVLDLEVHDLAVLQRAEPLVVGAAGNEIAGV